VLQWLSGDFYHKTTVCSISLELGCEVQGIYGHFAVLSDEETGVRDKKERPQLPRYDVMESRLSPRQRWLGLGWSCLGVSQLSCERRVIARQNAWKQGSCLRHFYISNSRMDFECKNQGAMTVCFITDEENDMDFKLTIFSDYI
jgi:hypothetical protein